MLGEVTAPKCYLQVKVAKLNYCKTFLRLCSVPIYAVPILGSQSPRMPMCISNCFSMEA